MDNQTKCINCGAPVEDYKPEYCCDGRECGCFGRPIDPPICSQECWDAGINRIPKEEQDEQM